MYYEFTDKKLGIKYCDSQLFFFDKKDGGQCLQILLYIAIT
jgi:hypothetical protein